MVKRGRPRKEVTNAYPAQATTTAPFKVHFATRILDKNSYSLLKICELMELEERIDKKSKVLNALDNKDKETGTATASGNSSTSDSNNISTGTKKKSNTYLYNMVLKNFVHEVTERLKKRMKKRLIKLTRWADAAPNERQFHPRSHIYKTTGKNGDKTVASDAPSKISFTKKKDD